MFLNKGKKQRTEGGNSQSVKYSLNSLKIVVAHLFEISELLG